MTDILSDIVTRKRQEIAQLKRDLPLAALIKEKPELDRKDFAAALSGHQSVKIIAEIKKASPSRGVLIENFKPEKLATQYRDGGACALSVLTEQHYFQGDPLYLVMAKRASGLTVLWKDFIIDDYQLHYARRTGADAVLLIARLHTDESLANLLRLAGELGLDCLVEAHTTDEVRMAVETGAKIIGVNNRDLKDFSVSLERSRELAADIPDDRIKVAESGIFSTEDISQLRGYGFDCFLIGEALVKSADPTALLKELCSA